MKRIIANFAAEYIQQNMNRIFHRRTTRTGTVGVVLLAAVAMMCFWQHTGVLAIVGACAALTALVGIERMIHTTYTLCADGTLVIDKGRLSRPTVIGYADIVGVSVGRGGLSRHGHVAIELAYGADVMVYPADAEAFARALRGAVDEYMK